MLAGVPLGGTFEEQKTACRLCGAILEDFGVWRILRFFRFFRFREISKIDHDGYAHLELHGDVLPSKTHVSEAFEKVLTNIFMFFNILLIVTTSEDLNDTDPTR